MQQRAESRPHRSSRSSPLLAKFFEPVDIGFLVYLRIIFGGIMFWEVCRYFAHGWINRYYIAPEFHFTYFGFDWIKPWRGIGMYVHFAALGLCAIGVLFGFCYRITAAAFFLGFTYVFLLDETQYLNHFYLISLISFLLAVLPAHRALSIDVWLRPVLRTDVVPAWTLWLLRAQIGIPYFFGGIAKLNRDWLHGEPMRMWLADSTDFPVIGHHFTNEAVVFFFAIGGLLLDLCIVPLLLWKRTRLLAFVGAASFHLLNAQLFRIGIFPWLMLAATLVFFPPDTPGRLLRKLGFQLASAKADAGSAPRPIRKGLIGALSVYLAWQILLPLRHFLYPGDVNWTEEGHRFSWHMKLRTKDGNVMFAVTDPKTGRSWTVDPRPHLTRRQYDKMVTQPDMILQFSHHLAREQQSQGHPQIEVRALTSVSLNGRKEQPLIDPNVDLARQSRSLRRSSWIMELTEPLPKPGRQKAGESKGDNSG